MRVTWEDGSFTEDSERCGSIAFFNRGFVSVPRVMFVREDSANMFIDPKTVLQLLFHCVQVKGLVILLNGHNSLRKHLHVMELVRITHAGMGKSLICLSIYFVNVMFWLLPTYTGT